MRDNGCLELGGWHWRLSSWKPCAVRGFIVDNTGHSPCFHRESDIERVDPFPKYNDHRLDAGADHAWVGDTGLHMWILCFRIGSLGIMVWMVLFSRGFATCSRRVTRIS